MPKSHAALCQAIQKHPDATISELAQYAGMSPSRVSQIIRILKDTGKLKRQGSNKVGAWMLL